MTGTSNSNVPHFARLHGLVNEPLKEDGTWSVTDTNEFKKISGSALLWEKFKGFFSCFGGVDNTTTERIQNAFVEILEEELSPESGSITQADLRLIHQAAFNAGILKNAPAIESKEINLESFKELFNTNIAIQSAVVAIFKKASFTTSPELSSSKPSKIPNVVPQPSSQFTPLARSKIQVAPNSPKTPSSHGNKHQGLVDVKEIIKKNHLIGISVPESHEITHESVLTFIDKHANKVKWDWAKLRDDFKTAEDKREFLRNSASQLEEIQQTIMTAFQEHGHEFPQQDLQQWIESKKSQENPFLMVRSDGMEDADDMANAGGNLSDRYVSRETPEVLNSCGRVVASYFGETSLINQIHAGRNPFERLPQLSVLLHELIGESPIENPSKADFNEELRSGVLFSNDRDLSGDPKDNFRVTTISVGFGHGEGVVNSKGVNTDTIYITDSHRKEKAKVLYQNNPKPKRLAPVKQVQNVDLELVANPETHVKKRALSKAMVQRIYAFAKLVEQHTGGKPMDIEFVIKNDHIYIVQMRPINRNPIIPQYLEKPETVVVAQQVMKTLVPGINPVVQAQRPDQILIQSTLEKAIEEFDQDKHKFILVGIDEKNRNSHAIINAKGLKVPCFYCDEKKAKQLVAQMNANQSLVADQSEDEAQLILWNNAEAVEDHLKEGYLSHPAPLAASFGKEIVQKNAIYEHIMPQELKDVLKSLKTATTTEAAKEALSLLQTKTSKPLKARIQELDKLVSSDSPLASAKLNILRRLDRKIERAFQEITSAYEQNASQMDKLFHIKVLSTLLSNNEKALNTFSLSDMKVMSQDIERITDYEARLSKKAQFSDLLHIGDWGLTEKENILWEQFLFELEKAPLEESQIESFKEMVAFLNDKDTLPMWLNLIVVPSLNTKFEPALKEEDNSLKGMHATQALEALLGAYENEKATLAKVNLLTKKIEAQRDRIIDFADRKEFESAQTQLKILAQEIANQNGDLREQPQLSRMLITQAMKEYVEVVDSSIKNMKGSFSFTDEEKAEHLIALLDMNFATMAAWMKGFEEENIFGLTNYLEAFKKEHTLVVEKFQKEKQLLLDLQNKQRTPAENEELEAKKVAFSRLCHSLLSPSSGFSVLAATYYSSTTFERHKPETLEDVFTLIHQNQLAVIAGWNNSIFPENTFDHLNLPGECKKLISLLMENNQDLRRTGFSMTEKHTVISYNLPLLNHSAVMDFEIDRDQKVTFSMKFFGIRGNSRWYDIARMVNAFNAAGIVDLKECLPPTDQEVQFSIFINPESTGEDQESKIEKIVNAINVLEMRSSPRGEKLLGNTKSFFSEKERVDIGKALFDDHLPALSNLKCPLSVYMEDFFASGNASESMKLLEKDYAQSRNSATIHEELTHLVSLKYKLKSFGYDDQKKFQTLLQFLLDKYLDLPINKQNLPLLLNLREYVGYGSKKFLKLIETPELFSKEAFILFMETIFHTGLDENERKNVSVFVKDNLSMLSINDVVLVLKLARIGLFIDLEDVVKEKYKDFSYLDGPERAQKELHDALESGKLKTDTSNTLNLGRAVGGLASRLRRGKL